MSTNVLVYENGQKVIRPAHPEELDFPSVVLSIPQTVTRRQARQALLISGHLSSVQPAIDAIPDDLQRGMVQIEWDDSQTFERQRPTLIALATAIGMDSEAIDNLFIQAAQL